jgi:hypothetical protein
MIWRLLITLLVLTSGFAAGTAMRAAGAGAVPARESQSERTLPCAASAIPEVRFDASMGTTVVQAVRLTAPACPRLAVVARVALAGGGEVTGAAELVDGSAIIPLSPSVRAADVTAIRLRIDA